MDNPSQSYCTSVELIDSARLEVVSIKVEAGDFDFPTIPGMADSLVLTVLDPAEPLDRDVAVPRLVPIAT